MQEKSNSVGFKEDIVYILSVYSEVEGRFTFYSILFSAFMPFFNHVHISLKKSQ